MMLNLFLASAALIGHGALWVWLFNSLHAVPLNCRVIHILEKLILVCTAATPLWFAWQHGAGLFEPATPGVFAAAVSLSFGYLALCWLVASYATPVWLVRRLWPHRSPALASDTVRKVDIAQELGRRPVEGLATRLLAAIPSNEIFTLHIHDKTLAVPGLPDALAGMTIAHLSDLHFTGGLTREYFERVVEETNALDCDFIALTGDILDCDKCLPWIPETVGKLRARHGVFYVLGNHDKRVADVAALRRMLNDAGLIGLGGRWRSETFGGEQIIFAGNEAPWFLPTPDLTNAPPPRRDRGPFRILLSHSPDQYAWAKRRHFDLVLAGHTHGGQVRLPWIGAIVAPSVHGVKYACGVFSEPPTVMHVSRGISGLQPLRINCPPELARLTLCSAEETSVFRTGLAVAASERL